MEYYCLNTNTLLFIFCPSLTLGMWKSTLEYAMNKNPTVALFFCFFFRDCSTLRVYYCCSIFVEKVFSCCRRRHRRRWHRHRHRRRRCRKPSSIDTWTLIFVAAFHLNFLSFLFPVFFFDTFAILTKKILKKDPMATKSFPFFCLAAVALISQK